MEFDEVSLHWLWRETRSMLEAYSARAREGKALEAGLAFAQYVLQSGLVKLCERNKSGGFLRVDGEALRTKAENLQELCRQQWTNGKTKQTVELAELEKINQKLDLIAGHIGRALPAVESFEEAEGKIITLERVTAM